MSPNITLLPYFQRRLESHRNVLTCSSFFLCDARLFRLARILLIEREINRRTRGLIKFYDRRRYAGAYGIIYDTSSSP